jgi:hypothetical protein
MFLVSYFLLFLINLNDYFLFKTFNVVLYVWAFNVYVASFTRRICIIRTDRLIFILYANIQAYKNI